MYALNDLSVVQVEYLCTLLDREFSCLGGEYKGLQCAIGDEAPAAKRIHKKLKAIWELQKVFDSRKRELRQIEEVRRRAADAGVIKQDD